MQHFRAVMPSIREDAAAGDELRRTFLNTVQGRRTASKQHVCIIHFSG